MMSFYLVLHTAHECHRNQPHLKVHSPVGDEGKENREDFQQGFYFVHFLFRKSSAIGHFCGV